MGTQKNRLNETVLLSTKHMIKLMDKKIITILHNFFVLNWPYESIRCKNNLLFNYCKLQNKSVISVLSLFC